MAIAGSWESFDVGIPDEQVSASNPAASNPAAPRAAEIAKASHPGWAPRTPTTPRTSEIAKAGCAQSAKVALLRGRQARASLDNIRSEFHGDRIQRRAAGAVGAARFGALKAACATDPAVSTSVVVTVRPLGASTNAAGGSRKSDTRAPRCDGAAARVATPSCMATGGCASVASCTVAEGGVAVLAAQVPAVSVATSTCATCASAARRTARTLPGVRSALLAHGRSSPSVTR